ncbi:hypothetical protein F8388_017151 [Cannabis sativa]|uniref:Uncharacterized protein n=1 Tax=Cannabis sativa TaxID=3483 RepID=A0A7J6GDB7_CANSA|nr:hypothetical protein F8388_017151 [Cannabis sativa]KAF4401910.1 hypothetical protein G4B88_017422 [Cannabis sativa]
METQKPSRLSSFPLMISFYSRPNTVGHDGLVMGMACHPSGGLLAIAGADRKVLVWDVDGGFCTHYFKGHKGVV